MQIDRHAPLKVTSTTIVGNHLTRPDTIERRLQRLYSAETVQDVAQSALEASRKLEQLNIFSKIELELLPGSRLGEASIKVNVEEKRVLSLKATTFVEQGEGGVELAMRASNALGSAEALELSALMGGSELKGTPRRTQLRGDYTQPNVWGLPLNLLVSGDSTSQRPVGDSTYEDDSYGLGLTLKSDFGLDFEWQARQRDILPNRVSESAKRAKTPEGVSEVGVFTYAAPPEIITTARPSLKSAVALQFSRDRLLPNAQVPRTGFAGSIRLEYAAPRITGGDVDLFSLIGKIKRTFPLTADISLTTAFEGGVVRPLTSEFVHIQDRLFLGGPMGLRGFQPRGVGPKSADGTASLGGRNRWQVRVGLEGPPPDWSILPSTARTHMFLVAGGLSDEFSIRSLIKSDSRVAVGCGLAMGLALGRLEANVVYSVKTGNQDALSGRLQFGIGGEFL